MIGNTHRHPLNLATEVGGGGGGRGTLSGWGRAEGGEEEPRRNGLVV